MDSFFLSFPDSLLYFLPPFSQSRNLPSTPMAAPGLRSTSELRPLTSSTSWRPTIAIDQSSTNWSRKSRMCNTSHPGKTPLFHEWYNPSFSARVVELENSISTYGVCFLGSSIIKFKTNFIQYYASQPAC